jgi:hypothetical protein
MAGQFRLDGMDAARSFVASFLTGRVSTPCGDLDFPKPSPSEFMLAHDPAHGDGARSQKRTNVLRIVGAQVPPVLTPITDWNLRGTEPPYWDLNDLCSEYNLPNFRADVVSVDVIAHSVAEVMYSSAVSGETAEPEVLLARGCDQRKVSLGYRVFQQNRVVARGIVESDKFQWVDRNETYLGRATLAIPRAAMLHCWVCYDGVAQHFAWLFDQSIAQNSRRAAYEAFDPGLSALREMLAATTEKRRAARELETLVSWLLWMLGFAPVHLGNTQRTQDAADLLAITPAGHTAVVECTTGLLKAEHKLSLLHERVEQVRRGIASSGNAHLRVLGVIATSKPRPEITADLDQAEKLGVMVYTREDLETILDRTNFAQDAEQLFAGVEEAVAMAKARHERVRGSST